MQVTCYRPAYRKSKGRHAKEDNPGGFPSKSTTDDPHRNGQTRERRDEHRQRKLAGKL